MLNQLKEFLATIRDHERRLRALESFDQVQKFVASGNTILDNQGLVSINNFAQTNKVSVSLNQSITTASNVDVTGISLDFTLARSCLIFSTYTVGIYLNESAGNTCDGIIAYLEDNVDITSSYLQINHGTNPLAFYTQTRIAILGQGDHTIKLQARLNIYSGSPGMTIFLAKLAYIKFGI